MRAGDSSLLLIRVGVLPTKASFVRMRGHEPESESRTIVLAPDTRDGTSLQSLRHVIPAIFVDFPADLLLNFSIMCFQDI